MAGTPYLVGRTAVADLANRPYWTRFWVIQEFLLARHVNIHCSNTSMDWLDFQDLVESGIDGTEYLRRQNNQGLGRPYRTRPSSTKAEALVMSRHPDKFPEFLQPLQNLLIEHRASQCKDARDRVFAFLGLVTTDERRWLERFFPDYTLSQHQVQLIATAHVVQTRLLIPSSPNEGITSNSTQFFKGLGVSSKTEAAHLLRLADEIDYLGAESIADILECIDLADERLRLG
ncbi:hypothetical protein LIA77_02952 [Sarocladium implicatum]|nr:hypothetical protein LIA77_02952 [Sarocladium implicatum]